VQFEDYITYDSPLNDCEAQTVKQVLDKQMIKPKNRKRRRLLQKTKQYSCVYQKD
jgi:hypothetical protein